MRHRDVSRVLGFMLLLSGAVTAQGVRDPMRPAGASSSVRPVNAVSALRLEGIIRGARPVAIVNGRLVRAGDSIAGARIVAIDTYSLRYERGGKQLSLNLAATPANAQVRVARSPIGPSRPPTVRPEESRE